MRGIVEWSTGEFDGATAQELRENFASEETMNDKQMTELQNLYASSEYRRASNMRTDRAKLNDPANRAARLAWNRAQELEAAMKAEQPARQDRDYAGNPKSPGGVMKPTDRYIPTTISDLAKLPPVEQANKARELRASIRDNKAHPYWNEHHEGHKQAVEEMAVLYKAEQLTDGTPTLGEE